MTHNIANKSSADQAQIALELKASTLIEKQRLGKISRTQVKAEIELITDLTQRQRFKNALNKFLKMKTEQRAAA